MAAFDNKLLYDIATRQQVYVENVKAGQAAHFDKFLMALAEELRDLLPQLRHDTLDQLTKVELTRFVRKLRETQQRLYSRFLDDVLEQLEDFMQADLQVSREIWAHAYKGEAVDDAEGVLIEAEQDNAFGFVFGLGAVMGSGSGLWGTIKNAPLPANGMLPVSFLKSWSNTAQAAVENAVRKAYANGETLKQLTDSLLKRTPQGAGGILQRVAQQGKAVDATLMQHIAQTVSAGISSGLFGRYQWYSVIDNRTTPICLSRNNQIFEFGSGPLPPAHVGCRSHIGPVNSKGEVPDETFSRWFGRQPQEFRDDYSGVRPLSLAGYVKKIALILSR